MPYRPCKTHIKDRVFREFKDLGIKPDKARLREIAKAHFKLNKDMLEYHWETSLCAEGVEAAIADAIFSDYMKEVRRKQNPQIAALNRLLLV